MTGWALSLVIAGFWVGSGLLSTVPMLRLGYRSPVWLFWGALLGPFAGAVLSERAERTNRPAEHLRAGRHGPGITVVVGVDGSPQSRAAVATACDVLGDRTGRLVLVTAIGFDTAVDEDGTTVVRARLTALADEFSRHDPAVDVVTGPALDALTTVAESEDADVVVVGRHGRGMTKAVAGSVCLGLMKWAKRPVLVVGTDSGADSGADVGTRSGSGSGSGSG